MHYHPDHRNTQAAALFELLGHLSISLHQGESPLSLITHLLTTFEQIQTERSTPSWTNALIGAIEHTGRSYSASLTLGLLHSIADAGLPWITASCIGLTLAAKYILPQFTPDLTQKILKRIAPPEHHATLGPWIKSLCNLLLHLGMPRISTDQGRVVIQCANGTTLVAAGGVLFSHNPKQTWTTIDLTSTSGETQRVYGKADSSGTWTLSGQDGAFTAAMAKTLGTHYASPDAPFKTAQTRHPDSSTVSWLSTLASAPLLFTSSPFRLMGLGLLILQPTTAAIDRLGNCTTQDGITFCIPKKMALDHKSTIQNTLAETETRLQTMRDHPIIGLLLRLTLHQVNILASNDITQPDLIFQGPLGWELMIIRMPTHSEHELFQINRFELSILNNILKKLHHTHSESYAVHYQNFTHVILPKKLKGKTHEDHVLWLALNALYPYQDHTSEEKIQKAAQYFTTQLTQWLIVDTIKTHEIYSNISITTQKDPVLAKVAKADIEATYLGLQEAIDFMRSYPLLSSLLNRAIKQIQIQVIAPHSTDILNHSVIAISETTLILRLDRIPPKGISTYLKTQLPTELLFSILRILNNQMPLFFEKHAAIITAKALEELADNDEVHRYKHAFYPAPMILKAVLTRQDLAHDAPETARLLHQFVNDLATHPDEAIRIYPLRRTLNSMDMQWTRFLLFLQDNKDTLPQALIATGILLLLSAVYVLYPKARPAKAHIFVPKRPVTDTLMHQRAVRPDRLPKTTQPTPQIDFSVTAPPIHHPVPKIISAAEQHIIKRYNQADVLIAELAERANMTSERTALNLLFRQLHTEPDIIKKLNALIKALGTKEIDLNQTVQAKNLAELLRGMTKSTPVAPPVAANNAPAPAGAGSGAGAAAGTTFFTAHETESFFKEDQPYVLKRGLFLDAPSENHQTLAANADLDEIAKYYQRRAHCIADQRTATTDVSLDKHIKKRNTLLMHGGIFIPEIMAMQNGFDIFNNDKAAATQKYLQQAYFSFEMAKEALPAIFARRLSWLRTMPDDDQPKHVLAREGIVADLGIILKAIPKQKRAFFMEQQSLDKSIIHSLLQCRNSIAHMSIGPEAGTPLPDQPALIGTLIRHLCLGHDSSPALG